MAAGRIVLPPYFPARDRNARIVPGAKLYVYVNGTTEKAAIYADGGLGTGLANPVTANASGHFPSIWAEAGTEEAPVLYSLAVTDADGRSIGNPAVFDDYRPSVDFNTAALALTESAAAIADEKAGQVATQYTEIMEIQATGDNAPAIAARARLDKNLEDLTDKEAATGNLRFRGRSVRDKLADTLSFADVPGAIANDSSSGAKAANTAALLEVMEEARVARKHIFFPAGIWYFAAVSMDVRDYVNTNSTGTAAPYANFFPGWIGQGADMSRLWFDQNNDQPIFRNDSTANLTLGCARFEGITVLGGETISDRGRGFIDLPNNTKFTGSTFRDLKVARMRVGMRAHMWQCEIDDYNPDRTDYGLIWTEGTSTRINKVFGRYCIRPWVFGCDIDIDTDEPQTVSNNGITYSQLSNLAADYPTSSPYTFGITRAIEVDGIGTEAGSFAHVFDFPLMSASSQSARLNIRGLNALIPSSNTSFAGLCKVGADSSPVDSAYPVSIEGAIYTEVSGFKMLDRVGGDYHRQVFDLSGLRFPQTGPVDRGISTETKIPTRLAGGTTLVGQNLMEGYLRDGSTFSVDGTHAVQDFPRNVVRIASGEALFIPVTKVNTATHLVVGDGMLFPANQATTGTVSASAAQDLARFSFSAVGGNRSSVGNQFKADVVRPEPAAKHGNKTWDPASLAAGAEASTTLTVTGAAPGDYVEGVSFSNDLQGCTLTAYVSAANTVTVVLRNGTAGAIDLASGTLRVKTRAPTVPKSDVSVSLVTIDGDGNQAVKITPTAGYPYLCVFSAIKRSIQDSAPVGWYVAAA